MPQITLRADAENVVATSPGKGPLLEELSSRGVNHKPPQHSDEDTTRKTNLSTGVRKSDELSWSTGRRSSDGISRKSGRNQTVRKSLESPTTENSNSVEPPPLQNQQQLSQITDILLSRLISTLSESTLGNPAMLLQTLLGFSPDDYNDLLAALSESHLSYVDIISAYLHNIKVMSEDSGSTSAALSGTLTRSLIEQYNNLLTQAVKSPQNLARASLVGDPEGRANLTDLIQKKSTGNESRSDRRQFDNALPKGPSGLGFGRRQSAESVKQRQSLLQSNNPRPDGLTKSANLAENGLQDFAKILNLSKTANLDLSPVSSSGTTTTANVTNNNNNSIAGSGPMVATTGPGEVDSFQCISPEQLTAILQNSGILSNGFLNTGNGTGGPMVTTGTPQFPMNPNTATAAGGGGGGLNFPFHLNSTNPAPGSGLLGAGYGMNAAAAAAAANVQLWTGPDAVSVNDRGIWQGAAANGDYNMSLTGWGTSLETVHENFNPNAFHMYSDQPTGFVDCIRGGGGGISIQPQQQQPQQQH
eukprot:g481.t1